MNQKDLKFSLSPIIANIQNSYFDTKEFIISAFRAAGFCFRKGLLETCTRAALQQQLFQYTIGAFRSFDYAWE